MRLVGAASEEFVAYKSGVYNMATNKLINRVRPKADVSSGGPYN